MRSLCGLFAVLLTAGTWLPAQSKKSAPKSAAPKSAPPAPAVAKAEPKPPAPVPAEPAIHKLIYGVEWRLIRAGSVIIEDRPNWARMRLASSGLVSKLYKIQDTYSVNFEEQFCATVSVMDALEGKRHRETRVTFDRTQNHAFFTERDVLKDAVVRTADVATPNCVHDVVGALLSMRGRGAEPGQTLEVPVSDGRRSASVKLEAQEREEVKTAAGTFKTIRYEAGLMNGVVYLRKGRVFLWMSDDQRRLPVRLKLQLSFPIGSVTLELEKEETS